VGHKRWEGRSKNKYSNINHDGPANQQDGKAYDDQIDSKSDKILRKSRNTKSNNLISKSKSSKQESSVLEASYEEDKMNTKTEKFSNLKQRREDQRGYVYINFNFAYDTTINYKING